LEEFLLPFQNWSRNTEKENQNLRTGSAPAEIPTGYLPSVTKKPEPSDFVIVVVLWPAGRHSSLWHVTTEIRPTTY
jgi:hypothetical protein